MQTPRYSIEQTDFAVPLVPAWTVQNSLDNVDAGRCPAQDVWHCWLIYQLDIILTLVCIVLASGYPFLSSYNKVELWNVPS